MDAGMARGTLLPGETVLWSGQPARGFLFYRSDVFMVPFSLFWCGFTIFWESTVVRTGGPLFMQLWGIPFIIIGLYLVAGRFLHDAYVRFHTWYAVTDRRVLIYRARFTPLLISLDLNRLPELRLAERGDGRGTIFFGQPATWVHGRQQSNMDSALDPSPKFVAIETPQEVFALLLGRATHA